MERERKNGGELIGIQIGIMVCLIGFHKKHSELIISESSLDQEIIKEMCIILRFERETKRKRNTLI